MEMGSSAAKARAFLYIQSRAGTSAALMLDGLGLCAGRASAAAETVKTSASRRVMSFFMISLLFFLFPALFAGERPIGCPL